MKIFIGADHRGFELKQEVGAFLKAQGYEVIDVGVHVANVNCDYPQISYDVATQVAKDPVAKGILLCMTGIGHSITANKVPGAYAALCYNKEAAALSRQHNDANILVIGSKFVDGKDLLEIIGVWLSTNFEGGRHQRRVDQIKTIEQEFLKG
ncbi:MAG: ribose 5-phosphate isomerase B [Candidatus Omnitrophota bacterium]